MTVALDAYQTIESYATFEVTFTCVPTVTLTSTPPTSGLTFEHNPIDPVGQIVSFSTYALSLGAPCYEYAGYTIIDDSDGSNADTEFIYDESTSELTLIGTIEKTNTPLPI